MEDIDQMLALIAQTPPTPDFLSGGGAAGWSAAVILVGVLAWLFKVHLPAKDAQLDKKDALVMSVIKDGTDREAAMLVAFKAELAAERESCNERAKENTAALGAIGGSMRELAHDVKNFTGTISMQVAAHHASINAYAGLPPATGMRPPPQPASKVMESVKKTVEDTNERVRSLEDGDTVE